MQNFINLILLKLYRFKSQTLASDDWISKIHVNFKRKVGQQITRWSCFPSAIEIINFISNKRNFIKQEALKKIDFKWQKKNGETRWFMPYDSKSLNHILDGMGVVVTDIITSKEITIKNILKIKNKTQSDGIILCFHKFSFPKVNPKYEVNHATVLYNVPKNSKEKINLVVPSYNRKYEINKNMVYEYKNWKEITKRIPTYVIFIKQKDVLHNKTSRIVLNKFKMWWL